SVALPAEQHGADGLPALSAFGVADDEQPGGIVSRRIQRTGQGEGEVLESPSGSGGDLASARSLAERRRPTGAALRDTARVRLPSPTGGLREPGDKNEPPANRKAVHDLGWESDFDRIAVGGYGRLWQRGSNLPIQNRQVGTPLPRRKRAKDI